MYAIYKVVTKGDTSVNRTFGSLESQVLVYLAPSLRSALEFFCDTDLMTNQEADDFTLGNEDFVTDGNYIYYIEQVR